MWHALKRPVVCWLKWCSNLVGQVSYQIVGDLFSAWIISKFHFEFRRRTGYMSSVLGTHIYYAHTCVCFRVWLAWVLTPSLQSFRSSLIDRWRRLFLKKITRNADQELRGLCASMFLFPLHLNTLLFRHCCLGIKTWVECVCHFWTMQINVNLVIWDTRWWPFVIWLGQLFGFCSRKQFWGDLTLGTAEFHWLLE